MSEMPVALVTGGATGIGAACAQGFLEAGKEVTISDANKDTLVD